MARLKFLRLQCVNDECWQNSIVNMSDRFSKLLAKVLRPFFLNEFVSGDQERTRLMSFSEIQEAKLEMEKVKYTSKKPFLFSSPTRM